MNKILNKLPIGLKLGGSFVIVILILTVSVIISYIDLGHLNNNVVSLYYDNTIPIQNLGETKALLGQIKSNIQLYIQIPQPKDNTSNTALIGVTAAGVDAVLAEGLEHHLFLGRVLEKVRSWMIALDHTDNGTERGLERDEHRFSRRVIHQIDPDLSPFF